MTYCLLCDKDNSLIKLIREREIKRQNVNNSTHYDLLSIV